jgi:hypothetical protein
LAKHASCWVAMRRDITEYFGTILDGSQSYATALVAQDTAVDIGDFPGH